MDLLLTSNSESDRGTLSQLKNFFNHRSLKKNVMENYQHDTDILEVSLYNTICILLVCITYLIYFLIYLLNEALNQ